MKEFAAVPRRFGKDVRRASLLAVFGMLISALPSFASDTCSTASRAASKAAQEYRNAVGKVRTACDSSWEECEQRRAEADGIFNTLVAANEAVSIACRFSDAANDDSLPFTSETIAAAIDLLPESVLVPCSEAGSSLAIQAGCPGGWILNLGETDVVVTPVSPTSFTYSFKLNAGGSIPIHADWGLGSTSCTITLATPTPIPVTGVATFSSSIAGGTLNRLELANSFSLGSVQLSGCGELSGVLELLSPVVEAAIANIAGKQQLCGAAGPELFGPCQ